VQPVRVLQQAESGEDELESPDAPLVDPRTAGPSRLDERAHGGGVALVQFGESGVLAQSRAAQQVGVGIAWDGDHGSDGLLGFEELLLVQDPGGCKTSRCLSTLCTMRASRLCSA
jgi:hypothetical protein